MEESGFITPPGLPLPQGEGVKRGGRANGRCVNQRGRYVNDHSGVTLTELLIVISIIGILAVALGFSYVGWMGGYKVESEVKAIYSDLMTAKSLAMARNLSHFVVFLTSPDRYAIIEDTNDNGAPNPGVGAGFDTVLPTFPKTVEYPVVWTHGTITFDKRGMMQTSVSPNVGGTLHLTTTNDADYDCLKIAETRILMGKWTTGANVCNAK